MEKESGVQVSMTVCSFHDGLVKCRRKAVSEKDGKPYCNTHIIDLNLGSENIQLEIVTADELLET